MSGFIENANVVSWGRTLRSVHQVARPYFVDELPALISEGKGIGGGLLAIGLRRSYGESGLNPGGALIDMTALDRFIGFDPDTGVLVAEAGLSLQQILDFAIPRGFFLPVTPGTRFVTLGGAVAHDVHGKNHHGAGTFGRWVREIGLLRSDGAHHVLRPDVDTGLFEATIGGMGLTGVATHVALQLKPIASSLVDAETIRFGDLSEFFALAEESADSFDYTVAWIDCLASGKAMGRGLFSRANHAREGSLEPDRRRPMPAVPIEMPGFLLNGFSISMFNAVYYALGGRDRKLSRVSYGDFFYPLDMIAEWNRLYGKRGMYQYQSVVPPEAARDATADMLTEIAKAGQGSFLVVLKTFGALPSPGLMSFPKEGTTLALDFPNKGQETLSLLARLDAIVRTAGGRLYSAKDGRMPPDAFRSGYPVLERFSEFVDPGMSSAFWRRMRQ